MNERLTNKTLDNAISAYKAVVEVAGDIIDEDYSPVLDKVTLSLLQELKQFRELEEQGLFLRLPCKVGDVVYTISGNKIEKHLCAGFEIRNNLQMICACNGDFGKIFCERLENVFVTRAAAEEKLGELNVVDEKARGGKKLKARAQNKNH